MAEIDSLQIRIDYDVSESLKNVKRLTDSLRTLAKATQAFSGVKTDGIKNLNTVTRAFSNLAKVDTSGVTKFTTAIQKLGESLQSLLTNTAAFGNAKSSGAKNLASISRVFDRLAKVDVSGAGKLAASARQIQNINWKSVFGSFAGIDVKNIKNLQQAFTALAGAATQAQRVMRVAQRASTQTASQPVQQPVQLQPRNNAARSAGSSASSAQQTGSAWASVSKIFKTCQKSASGLFNVLKKIGKIGVGAFRAVANGLKHIVSGLKHSNKHSGTFIARLKQIISRSIVWKGLQAVTRAASEGLKNLARASAEANAMMSELSTMSLYMKNSFGAALYPAIQMIISALRALVSAAASALNAINQLLSALGGKSTFIKAKVYAKDYADELESAGGSAKKLKTELMGFDEINQFSPENSGGGGGGSSDDYSSMFETVEIDKDILDAVKLNDFTALGRSIAEKINGALDKVNWDEIKGKAAGLAKSIATGINGFTDEINPQSIADTINGALSTAFEFVNVVVSTTDTKRIGEKIRMTIVAAIRSIDRDKLSTTVGNVISAAIGFIKGITLTPEDQLAVGQKIAEALNTLAEKVPLGELVNSIGELLGGMLGTMEVVMEETDFEKLGETIGEALSGVGEHLPELAGKLVTVAAKFVGGLIKGIKTYFEDNHTSLISEVAEAVKTFFETVELDGEVKVTLLKIGLAYAGVQLAGVGLKAAGGQIATALGLKSGGIIGFGTSLKLLGALGMTLILRLTTLELFNNIKEKDWGAILTNAVASAFMAAGIALTVLGGFGTGAAVFAVGLIIKLTYDLLPSMVADGVRAAEEISEAIPFLDYKKNMPDNLKSENTLSAVDLLDGVSMSDAFEHYKTDNFVYNSMNPKKKSSFNYTVEFVSSVDKARETLEEAKKLYVESYNTAAGTSSVLEAMAGEATAAVEEFPDLTVVTDKFTAFWNGLGDAEASSEAVDTIRGLVDNYNSAFENLQTVLGKTGNQEERNKAFDDLLFAYDSVVEAMESYKTSSASQTKADDSTAESVSDAASAMAEYQETLAGVTESVADVGAETASMTEGVKEVSEAVGQVAESIDSIETDGTFAPLAVSAAESAEEVEELKQVIIEVPTEKMITFKANTEEFAEQIDAISEKMFGIIGEKEIKLSVRDGATVTSQLTSIRSSLNAIPKSKTMRIHVMLTNDAKKFLESLNTMMKATKITTGQIQAVISTGSVVAQYAKGGFPTSGELFVANENGRQEMVGRIGNRSAVANQDQIGDAIFRYMDAHDRQNGGNDTDALASAIVRGLKQAGIGAVYLDGRMLAGSINRETQRTGKPAITF